MNKFIPNKIKVGFQERDDTYTGKLAYVIYYDEKNKLRKEQSLESWRNKEFEPVEFDNISTEGFVLNKKVGGYKSDWNFRSAYCRVYDPRDFEFEITIENLLYILENCSSIKGKGLEGKFVYAWDGKDLFLLPEDAPDYQTYKEFSDTLFENKKFSKKDLIIGHTYKTREGSIGVYLGEYKSYYTESNKLFFYILEDVVKLYSNNRVGTFSIDKIISVVTKEIDPDLLTEYLNKLEDYYDYYNHYEFWTEPLTLQDLNSSYRAFEVQTNHGNMYVMRGNKYGYYYGNNAVVSACKNKKFKEYEEYSFNQFVEKFQPVIQKSKPKSKK